MEGCNYLIRQRILQTIQMIWKVSILHMSGFLQPQQRFARNCIIQGKEQTKLDLKQPEPKTRSWIRFRFSRKPKLDILLRPRLCQNGLLSQNFGRNRNIGCTFGRNYVFCRIFRVFCFHLIPISPYWPFVILEGFRPAQTIHPKPQLSPYGKKRYLLKQNRLI